MIEEQKQLLEHSKMEYNKKLQVLLLVFYHAPTRGESILE